MSNGERRDLTPHGIDREVFEFFQRSGQADIIESLQMGDTNKAFEYLKNLRSRNEMVIMENKKVEEELVEIDKNTELFRRIIENPDYNNRQHNTYQELLEKAEQKKINLEKKIEEARKAEEVNRIDSIESILEKKK